MTVIREWARPYPSPIRFIVHLSWLERCCYRTYQQINNPWKNRFFLFDLSLKYGLLTTSLYFSQDFSPRSSLYDDILKENTNLHKRFFRKLLSDRGVISTQFLYKSQQTAFGLVTKLLHLLAVLCWLHNHRVIGTERKILIPTLVKKYYPQVQKRQFFTQFSEHPPVHRYCLSYQMSSVSGKSSTVWLVVLTLVVVSWTNSSIIEGLVLWLVGA